MDLNKVWGKNVLFPEGVRTKLLQPFKKPEVKKSKKPTVEAVLMDDLENLLTEKRVKRVQFPKSELSFVTAGPQHHLFAWFGNDGHLYILDRFYEYLNNIENEDERVRLLSGYLFQLLLHKNLLQTAKKQGIQLTPPGQIKIQQASEIFGEFVNSGQLEPPEVSLLDLRRKGFLDSMMWERGERFETPVKPRIDRGPRVQRLRSIINRLLSLRDKLHTAKKSTAEDREKLRKLNEEFAIEPSLERAITKKFRGMRNE